MHVDARGGAVCRHSPYLKSLESPKHRCALAWVFLKLRRFRSEGDCRLDLEWTLGSHSGARSKTGRNRVIKGTVIVTRSRSSRRYGARAHEPTNYQRSMLMPMTIALAPAVLRTADFVISEMAAWSEGCVRTLRGRSRAVFVRYENRPCVPPDAHPRPDGLL